MKIIKFSSWIILSLFLFVNNSFAINATEIKLGSGIEYSLEPNDPLLISNPYLWSVNAVCTIKNKDDDNFLTIKVTRKQGTLNDKVLKVGDSVSLRLHSKEKIYITAISGAEIELLNIGKKPIVTECSYGF